MGGVFPHGSEPEMSSCDGDDQDADKDPGEGITTGVKTEEGPHADAL